MKYLLTFLLLIPLGSFGLCHDLFKSKKEKNREKTERKAKRTALIHQFNHSGTNAFVVSLQTKDELCTTYTLPDCWPQISKTLAYDELDSMEWRLQLQEGSDTVEITSPKITSSTNWKNNNQNFTWAIRPLALGKAIIKACYGPQDKSKIDDEITYTITVIN